MNKTSSELQFIVLSSLLRDSSMMSMVSKDIDVRFFNDKAYQFIYKLLNMYFTNYNKSPSIHEVLVMVNQYYNENYGDMNTIKDLVNQFYLSPLSDPEFVKDSITDFIRRNKFEDILLSLVDKYNKLGEFDIEDTIGRINDAYEYEISGVEVYNPGNYESYISARVKALGNADNPIIIKSFVNGLNTNLQYRGYKYGDLVTIAAAPGVGKTSFLINEGLSAAMQGFNVLNIFLGDMTEYSASTRYMSCLTEIPMNTYSGDPAMYNKMLQSHPKIKVYNPLSRIRFIVEPPGEVTSNRLLNIVKHTQESENMHFDLIIVDYADNMAPEESYNSYDNGGKLYNKLKGLAMNNKSVVLTASQPKVHYFDTEVIPFDGLAESSKKQHVVDMCITLGTPKRGSGLITMNCPKLREGNTGVVLRLETELDKCLIREISTDEYLNKRAERVDNV